MPQDNINDLENLFLNDDKMKQRFNELITSRYEQLCTDLEASKNGETGLEFVKFFGFNDSFVTQLASVPPEIAYRNILFMLDSVSYALYRMMLVHDTSILEAVKADNS
ncbi:MAG: hypothetical protein PHE15_06040 [Dehalococcoidales bacterium]|nr:hypothetical protein [Dehalococcoidales bacterium]